MAKKSKKQLEEEIIEQEGSEEKSDKLFDPDKFLKKMKKQLNVVSMEESTLGVITDYFDTGHYGLNRAISGSCYKGIPSGRLIELVGDSGTGKTYVAINTVINALLKNKVDVVFLFDSEGGALKEQFVSRGVDVNKIMHVPTSIVEDCTQKMFDAYEQIREGQELAKACGKRYKAMFVLDSLGMMNSIKAINDLKKPDAEGVKADQGLRAKACGDLMRTILMPALMTDTTTIIINHVYDNPKLSSTIKYQGGGKKVIYAAQIIIQCSDGEKTKAEDTDHKKEKGKGYYVSKEMKFFIVKNRCVKPFQQTMAFVHFAKGMSLKYYGLIEPAIELGFIKKLSQSYYTCPMYNEKTGEEKKMYYKELLVNQDMWNTIMESFNDQSMKALSYGNEAEISEEEFEKLYGVMEESEDSSEEV